jgi:hypothetical protein
MKISEVIGKLLEVFAEEGNLEVYVRLDAHSATTLDQILVNRENYGGDTVLEVG